MDKLTKEQRHRCMAWRQYEERVLNRKYWLGSIFSAGAFAIGLTILVFLVILI